MLQDYQKQNFQEEDSINISRDLAQVFKRRRTIRQFSGVVPSVEIIKNALDVARLAPSGANKQPWSFCLIQKSELKAQIRELAEKEEYNFYHTRPNEKWLNDLSHLHTNQEKTFLTDAPYLVVILYKSIDLSDMDQDGARINYFAKESTGIATGMLISALHMSGLSTLTYTPTRMQFLPKLLDRPQEERAFMVLGVGLPKDDAQVPRISKKSLDSVLSIYE